MVSNAANNQMRSRRRVLTGLVGPELLDRDHRHGKRGSEFRRPGWIAEDRHGAWRGRRRAFELAFEQRPSCRGPSSRISSPRATSLEEDAILMDFD